MILRIMLIAFMLLPGMANTASLNEGSVRRFVESMDEAVRAKDMVAIDKMLSPDFKFMLVSRLFGVSDKVETDKAGFLSYTREGLNVAQYYKSKRDFLNIAIEGEKAICTSDLVESMVQRGMYISTVTSEKFVVEVVNGTLAYTSYEGSLRKK